MDQQVPPGLRLRLRRAGELHIDTARELYISCDCGLSILHEGADIPAGNVRCHRLKAPAAEVSDLISTGGFVHVRDLLSST
jgi:hypothetical protein